MRSEAEAGGRMDANRLSRSKEASSERLNSVTPHFSITCILARDEDADAQCSDKGGGMGAGACGHSTV